MIKANDKHEEISTNASKEIFEAPDKVSELLERGKKCIYPQRDDEWADFVIRNVAGRYYGKIAEIALSTMEFLENGGSFEDAKKIIEEENLPERIFNAVRNIVYIFSKKGPEFVEVLAPEQMKQSTMLMSTKLMKEKNKKFEEDLKNMINKNENVVNEQPHEK